MLLIPCPHCGSRNEDEFVCWSEIGAPRPPDPGALDDAGWADRVYNRDNARGPVREKWFHARGCQRWIIIERDTVTHRIGPDPGPPA